MDSCLRERGLANDMLLAASARDLGATIRNPSDFRIIARVMAIQVEPPWP